MVGYNPISLSFRLHLLLPLPLPLPLRPIPKNRTKNTKTHMPTLPQKRLVDYL